MGWDKTNRFGLTLTVILCRAYVLGWADYQWDTTTLVKGEKNGDEWLKGGLANILMEMAGSVKCSIMSVGKGKTDIEIAGQDHR